MTLSGNYKPEWNNTITTIHTLCIMSSISKSEIVSVAIFHSVHCIYLLTYIMQYTVLLKLEAYCVRHSNSNEFAGGLKLQNEIFALYCIVLYNKRK